MRASILIPVFNSASTLDACLKSATSQSVTDIEVLIGDDASTDGGPGIARRAAACDPRIKVFTFTENRGKPAVMNDLIRQAGGDWLAILDADDTYSNDRIARLIAAAERHHVDMAADNLVYVDAGVPGKEGHLRTAFASAMPDRIIDKSDLVADADSFGTFDYGILKPLIRRQFVIDHELTYYEDSRLAEDFTYLMCYMVAGGRMILCSEPMYFWTMPFGTVSRQWTTTGAGAWRYDYRQALAANQYFVSEMQARGETSIVRMLKRRGSQYQVMIHYIDAQKQAASGAWQKAAAIVCGHPSIWGLLARRVTGRVLRGAGLLGA